MADTPLTVRGDGPNGQPLTPAQAASYAESYIRYLYNPSAYHEFTVTAYQAAIFAEEFLGVYLQGTEALYALNEIERIQAQAKGRALTAAEFTCLTCDPKTVKFECEDPAVLPGLRTRPS